MADTTEAKRVLMEHGMTAEEADEFLAKTLAGLAGLADIKAGREVKDG